MDITPTNISLILAFLGFLTALIGGSIILIDRARKKTLEATRKGQPINKRGTWVTVIFLLCVLFVFVYMIATTQEEGINEVTSLNPGSHFVDRPPFIINVDHNEVAILTKHFWYYDVEYHKVTVIPEGHLGFRFSKKGGLPVEVKILYPGIYRIDLDKYRVALSKLNRYTRTRGNKEWDGDRKNKH